MPAKTIYLVRHAKSSWDNPELSDRERPLNKRGIKDAPRMAARLKKGLAKSGAHPQLILSSPAVRARTTAEVFADYLGPENGVVINDEIYGASSGELIDIIRDVDDTIEELMLVGHNPDLTWLANALAEIDIDNVPTCGIVILRAQCNNWKDIGRAPARLLEFDYPKKVKT